MTSNSKTVGKSRANISGRFLICGFGVNDIEMNTSKGTLADIRSTWNSMIDRCYNTKIQERQPTYIGCTVCEEWKHLSNFADWMLVQDYSGKHLDKDIIAPGNKVYSPETCCFVTKAINTLLTNSAAKRGKYPQGVVKENSSFRAEVTKYGKKVRIGLFDTPEEASKAYRKAKSMHILNIAEDITDPRIRNGLLKHAELLFIGA